MVNYDSDSSGAEADSYTETNVLLGYASKEASDDTISHLGGRPTWLDPTTPPSAALAKCKVCRDLMVLILQLNADLPEHFPGHKRRLYVLSCRRKACRRKEGSIRVLRGVRVSETAAAREKEQANSSSSSKPTSKPAPNSTAHTNVVFNTAFGDTLFGAKPAASSATANPFSNPFSTSASPHNAKAANPFAAAAESSKLPPLSELAAKSPQTPGSELPKTFASALSLNNEPSTPASTFGPPPPPEPWPEESALPAPYPLFYIGDADYEVLDKIVDDIAIPAPHSMDVDEANGSRSGGAGGDKEDKDAYESAHDKTFQAFADRLAQNPEQIIRYEFGGAPLLYSKSDAVGKRLAPPGSGAGKVTTTAAATTGVGAAASSRIPRCPNCAAPRVFEVQVTPHAILELESEELSLEGMDWGTIIIGVCKNDCTPRGITADEAAYLEEWAGVQWEELSERRGGQS
ncbi:MAG: hypothetical protein M1818_003167 [Claussenomyces sp. TS43310]|nr:MAG: hypothetical protein M1818_003167 [Claussenomyces sp. TS43310]